ncbi:hypothetical protein UFOVP500_53 [uncultured Caudovirales phage]|uniref:Uncharacterized protein n=1 Tax=uncultured Caudovirales phage TaxID=2100421 RepID=A0A6J5MHZ3_9CAUD|nr:hypothetical protein UFOVP500_53 [uncultured Caudovirales phage]
MKASKFTQDQVEDFTALFMAVNHAIDDYPKNLVFSMLGALLEKLIISQVDDHNTALGLVGCFTEILVDNLDEHYAKESRPRGDSGAKE